MFVEVLKYYPLRAVPRFGTWPQTYSVKEQLRCGLCKLYHVPELTVLNPCDSDQILFDRYYMDHKTLSLFALTLVHYTDNLGEVLDTAHAGTGALFNEQTTIRAKKNTCPVKF